MTPGGGVAAATESRARAVSYGLCRSRLPFRPLHLLHSAMIENKVLPSTERGLTRRLVVSSPTLKYRRRGRGAGAGIPLGGRALFADVDGIWRDDPVVLERTCGMLAPVYPRVRERFHPLRHYLTMKLLSGPTVSRGGVRKPVQRPGPGSLDLGRPSVAGLLPSRKPSVSHQARLSEVTDQIRVALGGSGWTALHSATR